MSPNNLYSTQNRPTKGNLAQWSLENMCPEDRAFYNYAKSREESRKRFLEYRKKEEEASRKKAEEAKFEKQLEKQLEEQLDKKLKKELEKALADILKGLK